MNMSIIIPSSILNFKKLIKPSFEKLKGKVCEKYWKYENISFERLIIEID